MQERKYELDKQSYIDMQENVKRTPWLFAFVTKGGKVFTYVSYVFYPLLLGYLFSKGVPGAWKAVVVPAAGFVILSVFRYFLNAPRPYEIFETKPLVVKNTKGKSFPSRHVFSSFIIAFTAWWFYPAAGFALCLCGCLLAVTRVLAGVHFPKDVIAGAVSGIGLGALGFLILM